MIIVQKAWENELKYIDPNKKMRLKDYIHKFIDGFPFYFTKNKIIKLTGRNSYKILQREKNKGNIYENIFSRKLMYKEDIYDFLYDYLRQYHYINAKMLNDISNYNFIFDKKKFKF